MKKKAMWLIAAAVFAADRVTKILAGGIPPEGIPLIPEVVRLRYAENTGAAFSMLSGHPWLLGVLSLLDKITGASPEHLLKGMDFPVPLREALFGRGQNLYARLLQYAVIYEMGNERLILPDIGARLSGDEVVKLYMKCMTDTDAALSRMED